MANKNKEQIINYILKLIRANDKELVNKVIDSHINCFCVDSGIDTAAQIIVMKTCVADFKAAFKCIAVTHGDKHDCFYRWVESRFVFVDNKIGCFARNFGNISA